MVPENKELLLKDLSSRLPYGVKVLCLRDFNQMCYRLEMIDIEDNEVYLTRNESYENRYVEIEDVKPYLFPISSMTEEQLFEAQEIMGKHEIEIEDGFLSIVDSSRKVISYLEILALLEWFYKNHFDIYGLIPMGLANDATGLNIY